jgi:hypothetical protein
MQLIPRQIYNLTHIDGVTRAVFKYVELNEFGSVDADFIFEDADTGEEYWIPIDAIESAKSQGDGQAIFLVKEIPKETS